MGSDLESGPPIIVCLKRLEELFLGLRIQRYWSLELKVFGSTLRFIHSKGEQFSPLALWPHRLRFALDSINYVKTNRHVDACERMFAPHLPTTDDPYKGFYRAGRLGQAVEGRAKRRIFTIGNYVNQRAC